MRIKRLRTVKGLTQEALAHQAKLSHGFIAPLEIGRHDPTLTTLRKLAKALGVPVTALLEWTES